MHGCEHIAWFRSFLPSSSFFVRYCSRLVRSRLRHPSHSNRGCVLSCEIIACALLAPALLVRYNHNVLTWGWVAGVREPAVGSCAYVRHPALAVRGTSRPQSCTRRNRRHLGAFKLRLCRCCTVRYDTGKSSIHRTTRVKL